MLGHKEKCFREHAGLSLEQLVPKNNFYRQVEAKLDLRFVQDLVQASYASATGRPSIDPIVFFKLQLIMFFEGIRSERRLMETVNLNLAHRWYIGYDLEEAIPDHSSLSKIRSRYGLPVFQKFFEKIVELCIQAGLIWGQELYFDGTKLGYHTHYVVDGGKSRIILAALVTPASVMDNTPMLDLARWTRFRWHLKPKIAVGDTKYGTIENIVGLERDGLRAYVPMTDFSQRTNFYPAERFQYEAASDLYRCPQWIGCMLITKRPRIRKPCASDGRVAHSGGTEYQAAFETPAARKTPSPPCSGRCNSRQSCGSIVNGLALSYLRL